MIVLVSVPVRAVLSIVHVVGIADVFHEPRLETGCFSIILLSRDQPRIKSGIRHALLAVDWIEELALAQVSRVLAVEDLNLMAFIA